MTEQSAMPSRAAVLSVIGALEGLGRTGPVAVPDPPAAPAAPPAAPAAASVAVPTAPTEASPFQAPPPAPAPVLDQAAQARHDQVAAALREMTAERDAWRAEASSLRDSLSQHLEALRGELSQHLSLAEVLRSEVDLYRTELEAIRAETKSRDEQISHLSTAMTALIQLAQSRVEAPPAAKSDSRPASRAPSSVPYAGEPAAVQAGTAPMAVPSLAPDRTPVDEKPRLGVERVKLVPNPVTAQQPHGAVAP